MLKYLKSLQTIRASPAFSEYTIVTGNQAADMDSCCSALLTAYLETELNNEKMLPLLAIPRSDLRLRRDVEFVFKSLNINSDWLLFTDDLETTASTNLFLVDHNAPTLPGTVKSILDHHEIEDPKQDFSHIAPNVIAKSGSCMSIVVNHYKSQFDQDRVRALYERDPMLASLAISPILQDTNNFTKKVEDEDRQALEFLRAFVQNDTEFSPFKSFTIMRKEKNNLQGLSMREMLRKDYKQWGSIGISSLPKLIEKLVKKGLLDLPNAMERFRTLENLDVMIALASGTNPRTDEYERQLVYCGPLDFDIRSECPTLQLELKSEIEGVRFYNQLNTAATRKQVAPEVKQAYQKYCQGRPAN